MNAALFIEWSPSRAQKTRVIRLQRNTRFIQELLAYKSFGRMAAFATSDPQRSRSGRHRASCNAKGALRKENGWIGGRSSPEITAVAVSQMLFMWSDQQPRRVC